ncbi:uncharacterized protein LOC121594421 [Anopheles merus]|uniref:WW domain binding protein VOPP1 n=1 Tax=Anopheles merus TaxID=30066 RepID=A0A182VEL8_ANOME|nr:uncharacterized protein LOC121594421 [Anopheles merus]
MSAAVHFAHDGILFLLLIYGIIALAKPVAGSSLALCEGGQTCLPPKECCAQGCCYLYAPPGAPRIPMASGDHVLGLLFLNHWYFWCFLFAVVLALLCTCSLWRRRRQLCGWDASARHSQSEGDSAGSCYAPPQYSRCNSFHIHAPPPYTEVASKPDLYPLVFSYTDPGKGSSGANYLMVQYFRNYIVQPVGSISGTSTVDSLSSSFICNANEANTLVPPPYSRAASPDQLTVAYRNYLLPRSASQQVCLTAYERTAVVAGARSQPGPGYHHHHHHHSHRDDDSGLLLNDQQQHQQQQQQQHRDESPHPGTISHSSNSVSLLECGPEPEPSERGGPSQPGAGHDPPGANCDRQRAGGLVCKHCCSLGDIASERRPDGGPAAGPALHKSLDTCCHVLLDESLAHAGGPSGGAKQVGRRHSGAVSSVGSNVSSLVNLEGPASSPPRATSPTAEVRELLEQIRQLHGEEAGGGGGGEGATGRSAQPPASYRRPSSLVGRRSKLFAKGGPPPGASRAMYIPVASCAPHQTGGQRPLRSPASMSSAASSFLSRQRHCWLSKSAPTTPGTGPGSFGGGGGGDGGDTAPDNRPLLLTEQEEDGEQNV